MTCFEIVGGPQDGQVVKSASHPEWAWVDLDGRVWRKVAPRRALYRLEMGLGAMVYIYVGHTHGVCCDSFQCLPDCAVCGSPITHLRTPGV